MIQDWSKAISDQDAAQVLAHLADDVVHARSTAGQSDEDLQGWFDTWQGPIGIKSRDMAIAADNDVAFATSLVRMTGRKTDGEKPRHTG